ncbi:MAG: TonB-dependent receptor [Ginsengibacter sp.]
MRYLKIFFLQCIFIFFTLNSFAQKNTGRYRIQGKITSNSGDALPGASVYITDLKKGAVADSSGNYEITNIPNGTYVMQVQYIGFKNIALNINFNNNIHKDFSLEISATEESEIVITGTSKATSIKRNPIPVISINRQLLQQNLNTNIIDAIARVPGISQVTTGPNVSKPFIRGLGFNRILTLYDGVRQEGQQWGDEHGIEVDENTVDKVEVVKGPASLIYGSDAVAGVINMLPDKPPVRGSFVGNFMNQYQTNNRLIENSLTLAAHPNDIYYGGTFTHKIATNYKNKYDGRVYNTGYAETDASVYVGVNKKWGFSKLAVSFFNDLQEIPDGSRDSASRRFTKQITEDDTYRPIVNEKELSSYKISALHQKVNHFRAYTTNTFLLGKGRLAVNLAYQQSSRQEFSHPEVNISGLNLMLNTFTYDAKYYFHESDGLSITAGLNGMLQKNNVSKGSEFIIPSYRQTDAGPFVYAKKSYNRLDISGGLRYDVRYFNNDALYVAIDPVTGFDKAVSANTTGAIQLFNQYKHTYEGWSGSAGLSFVFNKNLSMKANIGKGFRAPNISEIASGGVHPGTNIYQIGNKDFSPEYNIQEDLGLTLSSSHITINAAVFNNDVRNFIYNQKLVNSTGMDSVIVQGNETFKFVQSHARLYGGELSLDIHPHPLDWLHFENSLSIVYGENLGTKNVKVNEGEKYLPYIPPIHTQSELRANIKKIGKSFSDAFIKFQYEIFAAQNRIYSANNTETPTPGYQLMNAGFGTGVLNKKGKPFLNIMVMGSNLADLAYQSNLNRLKYFEQNPGNFTGHDGIYNMGRNFSLKVNVPF